MSCQDHLPGSNYLVQCQQLALQALACAAAATSNNNQNQNTAATSSALCNAYSLPLDQQRQLLASHLSASGNTSAVQQQLEKQQEMQQQQASNLGQIQWNNYQQAIAAALMSGGANTATTSLKTAAMTPYQTKSNNTMLNNSKISTNGHRFNPMRGHQQQTQPSAASKLKSTYSSSGKGNSSVTSTPTPTTTSKLATTNPTKKCNIPKQQQPADFDSKNSIDINNAQNPQHLQQTISNQSNTAAINLSASSLANLISLTSNGHLQFLQPRVPYNLSALNDTSSLLAKLTSSIDPTPYDNMTITNQQKQQPSYPFDQISLRLLESLFNMNDEPEDEAIELIAQRINSTSVEVENWFQTRREADRSLYNSLNSTLEHNSNASNINCSSPLIDGDNKSPGPSQINLQPESTTNQLVSNNQFYNQSMLNFSNFQQSILESVLGNNRLTSGRLSKTTDGNKSITLDHSENGSHVETFESDDDDYIFDNNNLQISGEDLSDPKAPSKQGTNNQLMNHINNNNLIDFYSTNPFLSIMRSKSTLPVTESPIPIASTNYKTQPPTVPSSTLLAKLGYVTSRPNAHQVATKLDQKMLDLLEAFYAINDNPEQAAIEMIAKRTNVAAEAISDWFDKKRLKTNPNAGPRSPPAKKREGGRVVTFSEYQRSLLEAIFDENNYLHPQEYEELSNLIQVPSRNIKIWFKNRRSKQRLSGRMNTPGSANNSD